MLEVPSLIWELPALLAEADFVSVGSNDLAQFFFASDRGNPRLADRYDPLSPAMLLALSEVARQCAAARRPLSVCGEIASKPIEAMALLGVGIGSLSMAPPAIGPVKLMVRSLELDPLRNYMSGLIHHSHASIRQELMAYARDHGVTF